MPDVSVAIASHDRPMRLRWLLNALEDQTLAPERYEVIVAHDSSGPETETLLREHPLAQAGRLRHITYDANTRSPGAKRNAAWRAARAPLIAFTDDDCRPDARWLESFLAAHTGAGDQVLQGTTRPDPYEDILLSAPYARTVRVEPPNWYAHTCNIAYPRPLLATIEGFDETAVAPAGEDTELWLRAESAGGRLEAVPDAVVYHAVEPFTLWQHLKHLRRWQHLAHLVQRHPSLRKRIFLGIFWRRRHAYFLLALAGLLLGRRRRAALLLGVPWIREALPSWGTAPHQRVHAVASLSTRAIVDAWEIAVLARGSLRYRTLYL